MDGTKSRILFVDDDQYLLDGLKRSLGGQRSRWEMDFVTSGAAALTLLDEQSYSEVPAVIPAEIDEDYLEEAGLLDRLDGWRDIYQGLLLEGHA